MWAKAFEFVADPNREIYRKVGAEPAGAWSMTSSMFRALTKFITDGEFKSQMRFFKEKLRSDGERTDQIPVDIILDTETGKM